MYPYEKGHCILLGSSRLIIKDMDGEMAFVVHIADPKGAKGRWVSQKLLPIPFAKINIGFE